MDENSYPRLYTSPYLCCVHTFQGLSSFGWDASTGFPFAMLRCTTLHRLPLGESRGRLTDTSVTRLAYSCKADNEMHRFRCAPRIIHGGGGGRTLRLYIIFILFIPVGVYYQLLIIWLLSSYTQLTVFYYLQFLRHVSILIWSSSGRVI